MSGEQKDSEAASDNTAALFCYAVLAFAFALCLARQMGTPVKWVSGKPLTAQPGFWPVTAIIGMLVFGALELVVIARRSLPLDRGALLPEAKLWLRALEFVGWFLVYVLAVPVIGYLPATLAFCVLLALRLGYRSATAIVGAMVVALFTVVVFKSLLSVKIPGGQVYEALPDGLRNVMILYF